MERSRSIGVSNSQVTTGFTKCPGNFTSLHVDTPLVPGCTLLEHKNIITDYDKVACKIVYKSIGVKREIGNEEMETEMEMVVPR